MINFYTEDLGIKIKKIRELSNNKQEHMAAKLGISQRAYRHYENNEVEVSEEMLTRIAWVLDMEPAQIKYFDEEKGFPTDPKKEKLYEEQIALLKKQNEVLEAKIAALEKGEGDIR